MVQLNSLRTSTSKLCIPNEVQTFLYTNSMQRPTPTTVMYDTTTFYFWWYQGIELKKLTIKKSNDMTQSLDELCYFFQFQYSICFQEPMVLVLPVQYFAVRVEAESMTRFVMLKKNAQHPPHRS